ncbi:MAG: hypothetical protein WC956_08620 [bacterium]
MKKILCAVIALLAVFAFAKVAAAAEKVFQLSPNAAAYHATTTTQDNKDYLVVVGNMIGKDTSVQSPDIDLTCSLGKDGMEPQFQWGAIKLDVSLLNGDNDVTAYETFVCQAYGTKCQFRCVTELANIGNIGMSKDTFNTTMSNKTLILVIKDNRAVKPENAIDTSPGIGLLDTYADSDNDGIMDDFDNCKDAPNFDQADKDFNGIGDECDRFMLSRVKTDYIVVTSSPKTSISGKAINYDSKLAMTCGHSCPNVEKLG